MSITDELRKWAGGSTLSSWTAEHLTAIADRIDAEHRKAEDEWRDKNGDMWLKGYAACREELMEGHPVIVADLEKAGWVKLPVDADGVPIRVGDVVDVTPTDKFTGHMNVVVTSVIFKRSAALVTVDTADRPFTFWPNRIRHHHAPTVEDVLGEFSERVLNSGHQWGLDGPEIIAEYAAKLRLAGDAE